MIIGGSIITERHITHLMSWSFDSANCRFMDGGFFTLCAKSVGSLPERNGHASGNGSMAPDRRRAHAPERDVAALAEHLGSLMAVTMRAQLAWH